MLMVEGCMTTRRLPLLLSWLCFSILLFPFLWAPFYNIVKIPFTAAGLGPPWSWVISHDRRKIPTLIAMGGSTRTSPHQRLSVVAEVATAAKSCHQHGCPSFTQSGHNCVVGNIGSGRWKRQSVVGPLLVARRPTGVAADDATFSFTQL